MSNTVINWRFWAWHFQVLRWGDWRWNVRHNGWPIRISHNGYWAKGGRGRESDEWFPIALYDGGGYMIALIVLILILIGLAL